MIQHQTEYIDGIRTRKALSLFGFIVVDGKDGDFITTGKWFKWVNIKERKYKTRYMEFDDGWNCNFYWGDWRYGWEFVEITDKI